MMSQKVQIHICDSDLTIQPVFYCKDFEHLSRKLNFTTQLWIYRLEELDLILNILKDLGLEDAQIEFIETHTNYSQDTDKLDITVELDCASIKKHKKVKCFSWLCASLKKSKHHYAEPPMSTQAWKEVVFRDFN